MKEPEISVGIVNAQEIHFTLNSHFLAKGETVTGNQVVSLVKEESYGMAMYIENLHSLL